ncbi:SDR family oxidoreductase [Defluviimonas aestuarii]|uniref:SDR family NAD(P)-dependent oxidoreductase n=1 Tax=Albidovulum aestuarii TaxID=1130726 RepID=UPI00249B1B64|nr:SDR family oxidoreductase [Defluviimonas aestuarii]MDI3337982.1 SDR family oxidoreductase [Defluviimonas aestuarii]
MTRFLIDPTLADQTALVTGGLGGVGRETVRLFVDHGVKVVFTYADGFEDPPAAQAFADGFDGMAVALPLNLMERSSVETCLRRAFEVWGQIDILVNNAAVGSATVAAYGATPGEQDRAMLQINADGTLAMTQAFLTEREARGGNAPCKIINLSSVGGGVTQIPGFRLSDGMSKSAIAFLTRALAAEHVHDGVDVFAVCPGAVNTGMLRASTLDRMAPDARGAFVARMPKGRLIEPAEIAALILFLASSYSAPLHGSVIDASMGLGVRPGLASEPLPAA